MIFQYCTLSSFEDKVGERPIIIYFPKLVDNFLFFKYLYIRPFRSDLIKLANPLFKFYNIN